MKRTFRVAIILIPVAVLLVGIGLWRNHYLKIMNSEPEKVYNDKPVQPKNLTTDAKTPKVTHAQDDDNTDVMDEEPSKSTQRTGNRIIPEEMDNTSPSPTDTIFGDIAEENLTPEVVAAIKKYEEIQSAIPALNEELKPLLGAIPLDLDAITLINEKKRNLKQRRKDILETLARYSDEAFNELQATIARKKAAERMMAELDDPASVEDEERTSKIERVIDEIDEIHKSIQDMSRNELEEAAEKLEEVSEDLPQSQK